MLHSKPLKSRQSNAEIATRRFAPLAMTGKMSFCYCEESARWRATGPSRLFRRPPDDCGAGQGPIQEPTRMNILGISAFYHDSAAALVRDGRIVAAAQEERFTRRKHDFRFPQNAMDYCLREGGITAAELDHVVFYEKPLLHFDRLLETYLAYAPGGFRSFCHAMPEWLRQKLYLPRVMDRGLRRQYRGRYVFVQHHESHAASAFLPSPFREAAIVTLDGVGEWATATSGSDGTTGSS